MKITATQLCALAPALAKRTNAQVTANLGLKTVTVNPTEITIRSQVEPAFCERMEIPDDSNWTRFFSNLLDAYEIYLTRI